VKEALDLRYELKLTCDPHWLSQARSWIRLHPEGFGVAYPPRRVNSLYLDTPDSSNLNDNLAGIAYRQKLRMRWYGDALTGIQPRLEVKQKYNMLGRKLTYQLPCTLDLTRPWREIFNHILAHVPEAWRIRLQTTYQPTLLNRYQREYYVTPDQAVRVTLDFQQIAYDQRLAARLNVAHRLAMADNIVIEIKADQSQAQRLDAIAACFPIPRDRNSKYANGLLAALG